MLKVLGLILWWVFLKGADMLVQSLYESVPLWLRVSVVAALGLAAIPLMFWGEIGRWRVSRSFDLPIHDAIDHFVRTVLHSYTDGEMHAFESLHKAMCDGTLRVIGSKGEGRSPKRISSRKCKRLKPTKVVIPANRSAPRGVRFDLINKSEVPTPLVETDKPIGFTGLRVRSDDLYGLWPKNQEANAPRDFLDLQRCLDELIKYSGQDFPSKVTAREIGQSNALLVHLERACHILDKQGRKHPKIDKGLVLDNAQEWIDSLSKILAHDGPSGAAQ